MSEATHESSELENNKQLVSNFIEDVLSKHTTLQRLTSSLHKTQ
jgi:hypothetical protein